MSENISAANLSRHKTEEPFFSIVIPTKHRSALLNKVIDSILSQNFGDYEVIVVNNDDPGEEGTEKVLAGYSDSRIKQFRTGNLSMAENWNYGFQRAHGKYFTLLRDKRVFLPNSLENLHRILSQNPCDSFCWNEEISGDGDVDSIFDEIVTPWQTSKLIEMQLNMISKEYTYLRHGLPKTSNSCISHKLYDRIVANTGQFAVENAPDYTIAYQILFNSDVVHNTNMFISHSFNHEVKYSTGAQHDLGYLNSAVQNMNSKATNIQAITSQPLKITNTETIVIDDFFRVAKLNGKPYSFADFNTRNYFKTTYINTIRRQATIQAKENHRYFVSLKKEIRKTMKMTYSKGRIIDTIYCRLLDVVYYPYRFFGTRVYYSVKSSLPGISSFMEKVARKT